MQSPLSSPFQELLDYDERLSLGSIIQDIDQRQPLVKVENKENEISINRQTSYQDDFDESKHVCLIRNIYTRTNKKLNIEMCLRLDDLIQKKRINLTDLDNQDLIDVLQLIEKANIDLFDKFIQNECDEYDDEDCSINLLKLVFKMEKVNQSDVPEEKDADDDKDDNERPDDGSTQFPSSRSVEQRLVYEFTKRGYKYTNLKRTRVISLDRSRKSKKINNHSHNESDNESGDDENFKFVDPKNCYGVKLSQTRYGKTCYVRNLPTNELNFELELFNLFAPLGCIYEMKIECSSDAPHMPTGDAYVTFTTREAVRLAFKKLDGHMFRPKIRLNVEDNLAETCHKVCLVNLPFDLTYEDFKSFICKHFDGIRKVDLEISKNMPTAQKRAFIDFIDHAHAEQFHDLILNNPEKYFPKSKVLPKWYHLSFHPMIRVANLPIGTNHEQLKRLFDGFGQIIWYKQEWPNVFVKLGSDMDNVLASDELNLSMFDGRQIRVTMSKGTDSENRLDYQTKSSNMYRSSRDGQYERPHQRNALRSLVNYQENNQREQTSKSMKRGWSDSPSRENNNQHSDDDDDSSISLRTKRMRHNMKDFD